MNSLKLEKLASLAAFQERVLMIEMADLVKINQEHELLQQLEQGPERAKLLNKLA